jgi:hypothetical protein
MTISEIKFISSIGTLGQDRMIINIPKKYHGRAREMKGKEVIVIIREALED